LGKSVKQLGRNYLAAIKKVNGNNGLFLGVKDLIFFSLGATWIWSSDAQNDNEVYFFLDI